MNHACLISPVNHVTLSERIHTAIIRKRKHRIIEVGRYLLKNFDQVGGSGYQPPSCMHVYANAMVVAPNVKLSHERGLVYGRAKYTHRLVEVAFQKCGHSEIEMACCTLP